jgi:hypothetical protein
LQNIIKCEILIILVILVSSGRCGLRLSGMRSCGFWQSSDPLGPLG